MRHGYRQRQRDVLRHVHRGGMHDRERDGEPDVDRDGKLNAGREAAGSELVGKSGAFLQFFGLVFGVLFGAIDGHQGGVVVADRDPCVSIVF